MAITQVANPASVPSAVADYQAQNAHIAAFNNIVNNQPFILTNSSGTGLPAIKVGTYIQYGGNLYVVDTEDYAITGTPVDGNNYIRLSGSTTLTAEWVQDISGYAWNEVYGYKESGSYFLLPYLVVKDGASYEKYGSFGIVKAREIDSDIVKAREIDSYKSSINIISGGLYPDYSGISYGDVELTYPTTTGSFTTTVSQTTYQEVKSIKLIEDVFTAMDPESEYHILGVRLVITNKGSSGANNAQYRIKINGVVAYESPMERGGVVYNIDLSCNEHDIITIECRSSNAGSVVAYENYYLRFNRDTTKSERLIEYAKRTFGIF